MLEKTYYCTYKNHKGEKVTEAVFAVSANAAMRAILLKHPLAEFQEKPNEEAPKTVTGNERGKKNSINRRLYLPILIMASLLIVSAILAFRLSSPTHLEADKNSPEQSNLTQQEQDKGDETLKKEYADAYQYIVSIRTTKTAGTGFKLKIGDKTYLYTCYHCIRHMEPVIAKDSADKTLELGELELCYDRDLARFELPEEKEGFELAGKDEIKVGVEVVAYGDTLGKGVMTQNKGKILAVGNHKLEIDAAVLCGNSGGPVLNHSGHVLGVVSSGAIDDTIWSKDTRYEKVRKFAERADGGEWEFVSYEDFRAVYAYLCNVHIMVEEIREFSREISGRTFSERIYRPFANDNLYTAEFSFASNIKGLYQTWNTMVDVEDERQRLWNKTNGMVGTRTDENHYYDVVMRRNHLLRQVMVEKPLQILRYVANELKDIDMPCLNGARKYLLNDIVTVLIPAFEEDMNFTNRLNQRARAAYEQDYKNAR